MFIPVFTLMFIFSLVHGSENIKHSLKDLIIHYEYFPLKEYLTQKEVKKYIAQDEYLFCRVLQKTDNPLIIKLFIDNGINLNYHDQHTNKTVFHLIAKHGRLINDDIIIPLIARFITTKKNNELLHLSHVLSAIVDKKEHVNYKGKTAYQKAHAKEQLQLKRYGRPYLYVDPLVEIILLKQDPTYLKNGIEHVLRYKNQMHSEQNFNTFKHKTLPLKKRIDGTEQKIAIKPTIATKLLNEKRWQKYCRSSNNGTIKILENIRLYREKNKYDQFSLSRIEAIETHYNKKSNSCPTLLFSEKNTTDNPLFLVRNRLTINTPKTTHVTVWDPLSNNLCEINADNNL